MRPDFQLKAFHNIAVTKPPRKGSGVDWLGNAWAITFAFSGDRPPLLVGPRIMQVRNKQHLPHLTLPTRAVTAPAIELTKNTSLKG